MDVVEMLAISCGVTDVPGSVAGDSSSAASAAE
jgi:hypothetical protein